MLTPSYEASRQKTSDCDFSLREKSLFYLVFGLFCPGLADGLFSCLELHQKFLTQLSACVAHWEESIYQARQEICSFALLFLPGLVNGVCRVAVITAQLELVYFGFVL